MATKKKRKATTKKKAAPKSTLLDRLPKNEREYIERLIEMTERNISPHNSSVDEFFKGQAARLRKKLEELKD
jgi:hypothetical protein